MVLFGDMVVKYRDGTMKKLSEVGQVEPVLFPDSQVSLEPDEPTIDLEDYIRDVVEAKILEMKKK